MHATTAKAAWSVIIATCTHLTTIIHSYVLRIIYIYVHIYNELYGLYLCINTCTNVEVNMHEAICICIIIILYAYA